MPPVRATASRCPAEPILPLLDDLAAAGHPRRDHAARGRRGVHGRGAGASRPVGPRSWPSHAPSALPTQRSASTPRSRTRRRWWRWSARSRRSVAGREAFQESDLVGRRRVAGAVGGADRPRRPDAPASSGKAWRRLDTGRPGPVLLSVPDGRPDRRRSSCSTSEPPKPPGARGPAADRSAVSRAMKMLAASERGVIVAGGGVLRARATKRLVALSEALAVPVIAAWRRPDVFPNDHANYLGMAGSWSALDRAAAAGRRRRHPVRRAHGFRRSPPTATPSPAAETRWIHVDVQPARGACRACRRPTLSVAADASRFLDSAWSDLRGAALDNEMRSRREARNAADREAYRAASDVDAGELGAGPASTRPRSSRPCGRPCRTTPPSPPMPATWPRFVARGLPLPASGHIPGCDVGHDGLRSARGHRGLAHGSRSHRGGASAVTVASP